MSQPIPPGAPAAAGAAPDAVTFPCKNCGAKLTYDAASQGMACPFCGHKESVQAQPPAAQPGMPGGAPGAQGAPGQGVMPPMPAHIREIPLEEGMRLAQRGLGATVQTINCKDCGATVNVGQGERTTACAFCGSKQVLAQQTNDSAIRPESLLPFRIVKEDANKRFAVWLAALWFRPSNLKKMAKVQEMGGVYVPFWTFDSLVRSQWTAERGWHYYESESYTEVVNGQRVSRTRQVQRTRWESASGWRQDNYDDVLICAGKGLPANLVDKFSTFDTKQLVPYQPQFLSGWRAESYAIDLMPAWGMGQQKIARGQESKCSGDIGGDTHRGLNVQNQFYNVTFKHVLLPIWIAAYRYNNKVYRFLVNGQSGEVVGDAPWSFWKIAGLVTLILAIIAVVVAIVNQQQNADQGTPATPQITETTPGSTATATATATATSTTTATASAAPHHGPAPHPTGAPTTTATTRPTVAPTAPKPPPAPTTTTTVHH